MMPIDLEQVSRFCLWVHADQKRKYSGDPYHTHCARVAAQASIIWGTSPEMVAAAWLHDSIEDQPQKCPIDLIVMLFGDAVGWIVQDMTNVKLPGLTREQQKQSDWDRIRTIPRRSKLLKLLDRRDNVNETINCVHRDQCTDYGFCIQYGEETLQLNQVLHDANPFLSDRLEEDTRYLIRIAQERQLALPAAPVEPPAA
jgi:(p)ppGpp synthase/HD superfamily hydrolase